MSQSLVLDPSVGQQHPISIPVPGSVSLQAYRPENSRPTGQWEAVGHEVWWHIVASFYESKADELTIKDLEDGYAVIAPIPITIEHVGDSTYLASFDDANIAITGTDKQDAYQSLVAEILDTFDTLTTEPHLSPMAAAQLAVLRAFIVKP